MFVCVGGMAGGALDLSFVLTVLSLKKPNLGNTSNLTHTYLKMLNLGRFYFFGSGGWQIKTTILAYPTPQFVRARAPVQPRAHTSSNQKQIHFTRPCTHYPPTVYKRTQIILRIRADPFPKD